MKKIIINQILNIKDNNRGNVLLNLIIIIIVTGILGVTMISLTSTSNLQQVYSSYSPRANLLAESGFRYLASQYILVSTEQEKNKVLEDLNGQTYFLSGDDGQFDISVSPYFFSTRSVVNLGSNTLPAKFSGVIPSGFTIPASGLLAINLDTKYKIYSYNSFSGDNQQFDFNTIVYTVDSSPGLNDVIGLNTTVNIALITESKTITQGSGNSLIVNGSGTTMPQFEGVFEIVNTAGQGRDALGNTTELYTYKSRIGDTLQNISLFNNPAAVFSFSTDAATRLIVHRSAEISATGTVNSGESTETNRIFRRMVSLGDVIMSIIGEELIYDFSGNVLKSLLRGTELIGDVTEISNGKVGSAMTFGGDWDYARWDDDQSIDLSSEGSIGAWVKVNAFDRNVAGIIRKGGLRDDSDAAYSLEFREASLIRLKIFNNSGSTKLKSATLLNTGTWYHIAGTWGPGGMNIYINGQLDCSKAGTLVVRDTDGPLQIGAKYIEGDTHNNPLNGTLDEVFIFDTEKTLCEIRDIYNNPCNTGCDAYAYYPFNGNYEDESGEDKMGDDSHNGVGSGVVFAADRFGCDQRANEFELWDYIEIPSESDFDVTTNFTVSFWAYINNWSSSGSDSFVSKGDNSWRIERSDTTNNITFGLKGVRPENTVAPDIINDSLWHHIVVAFDGSNKFVYIDGILAISETTKRRLKKNNSLVRIGSRGVLNEFNGRIDDVVIWKRVLSATEITNIYNGTRTDTSLP